MEFYHPPETPRHLKIRRAGKMVVRLTAFQGLNDDRSAISNFNQEDWIHAFGGGFDAKQVRKV
ncbi:MAG: hypothetical protein HY580_02270 [Nitrospinae bacterium]|nr:hypothetical protein [Nitrospinota bacterium]